MTPNLAALLTLLIKHPSLPASRLGPLMWPDRKDTGPSRGGPSKLAVAMSYWMGRLERQDIVYGRLLTDSDRIRRWMITDKGRELLAAHEASAAFASNCKKLKLPPGIYGGGMAAVLASIARKPKGTRT